MRFALWFGAVTSLVLIHPAPAEAYIGPGAGFALLTSLLTLITTALLALGAFLVWPFRKLWQIVRLARRGPVFARRLIVVGFDGQDAGLTERLMAEGKLPAFRELAAADGYQRLTTTQRSSWAAWSEFARGSDPGLRSDAAKPFWWLLGRNGIWSTVLRVPGTFPPTKFDGALLSEFTLADVSGVGASFTLYTTREPPEGASDRVVPVSVRDDQIETSLSGARLRIELHRAAGEASATVGRASVRFKTGHVSEWLELKRGICRFQLLEMGEHVSLYVTPLHPDPERPRRAISHPRFYASYLAKRVGKYGSAGAAGAAAAVAAGVIATADGLLQISDSDREREALFHAAFDRLRRGSLTCVFDGARRVGETAGSSDVNLEAVYQNNDAIVGRIVKALGKDDLLLVVSGNGILFANRRIDAKAPGLIDLAPTALRALGVTPPSYMSGAPVFDFASAASRKGAPAV